MTDWTLLLRMLALLMFGGGCVLFLQSRCSYNTFYTMLPVFSLVLDKDVKDEIALMYPELYKDLMKVSQCMTNKHGEAATVERMLEGSQILSANGRTS